MPVHAVRRAGATLSAVEGDPSALTPLIDGLMKQIPHWARLDKDLAGARRAVVAADRSTFSLAADVARAMMRPRGGKDRSGKPDGRRHGTCRLNLQLFVDRFIRADLSVSGADPFDFAQGVGSEAAAFQARILPGVTYLFGRNFVRPERSRRAG